MKKTAKKAMPKATPGGAKKANPPMSKPKGNAAKAVAPKMKSVQEVLDFRKKKYGV